MNNLFRRLIPRALAVFTSARSDDPEKPEFAQILDIIRKNPDYTRTLTQFLERDFSIENWKAYVALESQLKSKTMPDKGSDITYVHLSWQARHDFFNKFLAGDDPPLNLPNPATPRFRVAYGLMNTPDTEHLDALPAEPRYLTDEVVQRIRVQLIKNLVDPFSRFEATSEGAKMLKRICG